MITMFAFFEFLQFLGGLWLTVVLLIFVLCQMSCGTHEDPTRDFEVSYEIEKARRLSAQRRCSHVEGDTKSTCSPDQTQANRCQLAAYRTPYANQPRRNG